MNQRIILKTICVMSLLVLARTSSAAVISYTYDGQHRLVQAGYSNAERTFYAYDAAGNLEQHVAITDSKYLQSWLLYFSMVGYPLNSPRSIMAVLATDKAVRGELSWEG